jgi:hypothetical protein
MMGDSFAVKDPREMLTENNVLHIATRIETRFAEFHY